MKKQKEAPFKVVPKNVKHTFTPEERNALGSDLAAEFRKARSTEAEFGEVKAQFKARVAEHDARIDKLSNAVSAGFEMRVKDCVVILRPEDREKDYYLAVPKDGHVEKGDLLLTEEMTQADFQQDLIEAEAAFENRESIDLFPPANSDYGCVIVGCQRGKWYGALRIKVGNKALQEPITTELRSFKERGPCIEQNAKRALKWLKAELGKDDAKGFEEPIKAIVEANRERAE